MKSIRLIFSCPKHFEMWQGDTFSVRSVIWNGFVAGTSDLSVLYPGETESEAQPVSYPMHGGGLLLLDKATTHEADNSFPFRSDL